MKRVSSTKLTLNQFLPWFALLCSVSLFGLHFFVGGGRTKLITDSDNYLSMCRGEPPGTPFNTRVAAPFITWIIAFASGASHLAAFQILTFCAVVASLLLLRKLVSKQGGSPEWQASLLLTLGGGLAATFGYTPVMADPLLLFLTCSTLVALWRGHFGVAVVSAVLAALTKEYGLLLAPVISIVAYRRGHRKAACVGAFLPVISFLAATLLPAGSSGHGLQSWRSFVSAMFGYQVSLLQSRGPSEYPKLLYMWSWSALWPPLVIALGITLSRLRKRIRMQDHEIAFLVMVVALPLLLLGDWGRSLLIVVPFGCAVATAHPLTRNARFAALLAIGGLSTALARPFHSESPPPQAFILTMTAISIASSLLIAIVILRFALSASASHHDSGLETPAPEVAFR